MHEKVLLLIIDGLRPDAITRRVMPRLWALLREGWRADDAVTVRPSATVPALTSLLTGLSPEGHGILAPETRRLLRLRALPLLPLELSRVGVETTVLVPPLPTRVRWMASAFLRLGGVRRLLAPGACPAAILEHAVHRVRRPEGRELVVAYLQDADQAGHATGWMSPAYMAAVGRIDAALRPLGLVVNDPDVLVIICADHGGGGVTADDHDHPHPLNDRIPLLLLGGRVVAGGAGPAQGLLDIPPTILHGFGEPVPDQYEGSTLTAAFTPDPVDNLLRDPFSELSPSMR